jgi:hypothetical protein
MLYESELNIYPNPVQGELKIKNEELKVTEIKMYNVMGEEVYKSHISTLTYSNLD